MPDDAPETPEGSDQTETPAPTKPQSLEDLLADLPEDRRKVILDQVSKPRTEAKNLRDRLRALEPKAAEYERLEAASKTDLERTQGELTAANQRAADAFARAARAEVKAALASVVDDPDGIVDDLNLAKFVTPDGDVDPDAIKALRSKYAGFTKARPPRPDSSQGSSGNAQKISTPQEEFGSLLQAAIQRTGR